MIRYPVIDCTVANVGKQRNLKRFKQILRFSGATVNCQN